MKTGKRFCCVMVMALGLLAAACGQQPVGQGKQEKPVSKPRTHTNRDGRVAVQEATRSPRPWAELAHRAPPAPTRVAMKRPLPPPGQAPRNRERYQAREDNPVKQVSAAPVSTFSVDVDTGSYANVRRFLNDGRLPPKDAVRVEELINYFDYDYPAPEFRDPPFTVSAEAAPCPWNPQTVLLRLGLKGYALDEAQRPPANLVLLVDVSGSMASQDKLPLLKRALGLLLNRLNSRDRVSIVVYAGAAGVALEPTPGDQRATILAAMERLRAGGSTAGGQGIKLAYAMARQGLVKGGANRVLLATDGDFNVGLTDTRRLLELVERQRRKGVALSTLGFGRGNYNEEMMERLADAGDGNYTYIDSLAEAQKALSAQASGNLFTIARDVKVQVEFNPAVVAEYRLIGYENRRLRREDFANDKVDAGDIGAGHTVTALYELSLQGSGGNRLEPLRYQEQKGAQGPQDELGYLKLRYKLPGEDESKLLDQPLPTSLIRRQLPQASDDLRWAAAVAGFGQLLRGGRYLEGFSYQEVLELARGARGPDPDGHRGGFLSLVSLARALEQAR
jgi:Ca-activated chloride channel family protein